MAGNRPRRFDHLRLGRHGEDLVVAWYLDRGYVLVDRNWTCSDGELDAIFATGRDVVFCEVKTRSSERFGSPLQAVNAAKQRKLRTLALRWLGEAAPFRPASIRFDVAAVIGSKVEVVIEAF